ncbi:hypothetical protein BO86DRAFT_378348 [Aspergillus japonicus CBS 114.51]|uniref:Uncharacterized protein n=1 Tax=Aspergillus japonicus CBS 114.51 TaxID=1448312 RepID=A0A8T8X3Y1_ASPJA|nr:hypothetical protein BO86DRAFT_378348 [Aspergillus japonicus CBS 114.51]RAH82837.1 hypothetical protein BO86DRAFT_378348 [Aspergillus japonicus CBS 114.51]
MSSPISGMAYNSATLRDCFLATALGAADATGSRYKQDSGHNLLIPIEVQIWRMLMISVDVVTDIRCETYRSSNIDLHYSTRVTTRGDYAGIQQVSEIRNQDSKQIAKDWRKPKIVNARSVYNLPPTRTPPSHNLSLISTMAQSCVSIMRTLPTSWHFTPG